MPVRRAGPRGPQAHGDDQRQKSAGRYAPGNPAENRLLPSTAAELERAGMQLREIIGDGGFLPGPTKEAFPELTDEQIQPSGRLEPGSRRTRKRRARYRTGAEGRISHLKRSYGLRRS